MASGVNKDEHESLREAFNLARKDIHVLVVSVKQDQRLSLSNYLVVQAYAHELIMAEKEAGVNSCKKPLSCFFSGWIVADNDN